MGLALSVICAPVLLAQQIQVRIDRGPYYAGLPILVEVACGTTGQATPSCTPSAEASNDIEFTGPQRSVKSYTTNLNGRISSSTAHTFVFAAKASKTGVVAIGPFDVTIDGETYTTESKKIVVEELPDADQMFLEFEPESTQVYAGQRFAVKVRWGYDASPMREVRHAFAKLKISSNVFDMFESVSPPPSTDETLLFSTPSGRVEVDSTAFSESRDRTTYVVAEGTLLLRSSNLGSNEYSAECFTEQLISGGGFFERARTAPLKSTAEKFTIEVLPLPSGAPQSFTGAIASDFNMLVESETQQARVGDPVPIIVTLRGDSDLERLRLPDYSDTLAGQNFHFPFDPPTGVVTNDRIEFEFSVRPKTPGVEEFPGLEFSWFDPDSGRYKTVKSRPFPLAISDNQVIASSSVFSAGRSGKTASSNKDENVEPIESPQSSSVNLAIETDIDQLIAVQPPERPIGTYALFAAGCCAIAAGAWLRRRGVDERASDRSKRERKEWLADLKKTHSMPPSEASRELAQLARSAPVAANSETRAGRQRWEDLAGKADAIAFAPNASAMEADIAALREQIEALFREELR